MWCKIISIFNKFKQLWKLAANAQYVSDKEHIRGLLEKIEKLEKDNLNLKNQLVIKENVKFDGEFLWLYNEMICLKCYDSSENFNRRISRLIRNDHQEEESFTCYVCGAIYESIAAKRRALEKYRTLISQAQLRF